MPRSGITPIDFAGPARRREVRHRRRRLRLLGALVAVIVLVAGAGWALVSSPLFTVKQVEVTGATTIAVDEVRRVAAVPMGVPLARVDTGAVASRVAGIPGVGSARVRTAYPSTVVVEIAERPLAFVLADGDRYLWVDAGGAVYNATDKRPQGALLGVLPTRDPRLLADVATAASALSPEVRGRVSSIEAQSIDSIALQLRSNARVVWGSAEQSPLKAQVLEQLLKEKWSVYDVSAPAHPTTR